MKRIANAVLLKPFAWLLVHVFDCEVYYYTGTTTKDGRKIYKKIK